MLKQEHSTSQLNPVNFANNAMMDHKLTQFTTFSQCWCLDLHFTKYTWCISKSFRKQGVEMQQNMNPSPLSN